jgi:hypothetical protein
MSTVPHRGQAWWMDALFMVGSFCFALGSVPGFAALVAPNTVVAVFFIGSLFFTSAATLQYLQTTGGKLWSWQPTDLAWAASLIQLIGTLWFNIDTAAARLTGLDAQQENLRVWTPDYIGSVCFLVASLLAVRTLSRPPWHAGRPWKVAGLNLLGSVFFMAAAIAAFVVPDTDDLLDASLANSGTFLGAICFLVAARIEIIPDEG